MHTLSTEQLDIASVVQDLIAGQTLIYPTETCYGLGCDAANQSAVDAIFRIKQRQADKPVLVLMADIAMAMEYIEWNETIQSLATLYWPGPLTIVAMPRDVSQFARGIAGPLGMVAFRVTSHPLAQALVRELGGPLVSTSANISAEASPYDIADVLRMFEGRECQPDTILDGGVLPHESPSTIVRVNSDQSLDILRQGAIVIKTDSPPV
jgi:L-threonylcarbamoyladenylate synthase